MYMVIRGKVLNITLTWGFLTGKVFDYPCNLLKNSRFNRPASSYCDKTVNGTIELFDSIKVENVSIRVELVFILICNHFTLLFV